MEYEGVRIPKQVYDSVPIVKAKAIVNPERLPENFLSPQKCPICNSSMEEIDPTIKVGYCTCTKCGYGQPVFNLEQIKANVGPALADLGKGALIALGIAALAYLVGTALENK